MTDRPTHRIKATGEMVFPGGYPTSAIEMLPEGFWLAQDRDAAIAAIKSEAANRIEEVAPWWRQSNALREPDLPESITLFAFIDAARAWSNEAEALIAAATSAADLEQRLGQVAAGWPAPPQG